MQKTKHEIVIEYIESLEVGEKVSVRQLARQMNISEGTVYRAIKEAENQAWCLLFQRWEPFVLNR